ncbi:hypothetical protein GQ43DRAFT_474898 [Delitschia confertaspora ATCC 74209]|uniref:Uncharacterized protein n=1 Tax=Delitschia confertaspora ATCC 74209 TaxID=1513339 RepID=A0A9P4MMA0_9PLEO|nr:hypothetical protein GQ43DRAFT_474898 [Delitschia confertaspora ATCC 74209]
MQYLTIFLAATLTGAASAASAFDAAPRTECGAGTQFYKCAKNSFSGCCSIEACTTGPCPDHSNRPTKTVPSTILMTVVAPATPSPSSHPKQKKCKPLAREELPRQEQKRANHDFH